MPLGKIDAYMTINRGCIPISAATWLPSKSVSVLRRVKDGDELLKVLEQEMADGSSITINELKHI